MRNLLKKCLCFLFAVVMIICAFPLNASASENNELIVVCNNIVDTCTTIDGIHQRSYKNNVYSMKKGSRDIAFYSDPLNINVVRVITMPGSYFNGYENKTIYDNFVCHYLVEPCSRCGLDNIEISHISLPIFPDKISAEKWIETGDTTGVDFTYTEDYSYTLEGEEVTVKKDNALGVPQNVVYKYVDGQQVSHSGIKDHVHTLTWTNKDDSNGCNVQIQYGGTYKVKKSIFSSYETVTVPFTDICELSSLDKKYQISGNKFDLKKGGIIYDKIAELVGYQPYQVISSTTSRSFRLRYLKYDGDKLYYGKWVYANKDGNGGNTSYVGDEDGNVLEDDDYGTGVDTSESQNSNTPTSIGDFFEMLLSPIIDLFSNLNKLISSLFTNANNIISSIGSVPVMLSKLLSFMPAEVWTIITLGMAVVILLRIFGR